MSNNKEEKISTINKTYVIQEVKEGFDNFELGDTGVRIEMRPRTGHGKYTNFSKKCRVICNSPNSKYNIDDIVWVPHTVVDNSKDGAFLGEEWRGKTLIVCGENNILFSGDDLTKIKSDEWVVFEIKKQQQEKTESGLFCVTAENDEEGVVICGALPKGDKITWFTSKRIEFYQKEVQYWVVHLENITSVNGKTTENFYEIDLFKDYEYKKSGVILKGQRAISAKLGVETKRERIMKLINPQLPRHGETVIALKLRQCHYVRPNDVLASL